MSEFDFDPCCVACHQPMDRELSRRYCCEDCGYLDLLGDYRCENPDCQFFYDNQPHSLICVPSPPPLHRGQHIEPTATDDRVDDDDDYDEISSDSSVKAFIFGISVRKTFDYIQNELSMMFATPSFYAATALNLMFFGPVMALAPFILVITTNFLHGMIRALVTIAKRSWTVELDDVPNLHYTPFFVRAIEKYQLFVNTYLPGMYIPFRTLFELGTGCNPLAVIVYIERIDTSPIVTLFVTITRLIYAIHMSVLYRIYFCTYLFIHIIATYLFPLGVMSMIMSLFPAHVAERVISTFIRFAILLFRAWMLPLNPLFWVVVMLFSSRRVNALPQAGVQQPVSTSAPIAYEAFRNNIILSISPTSSPSALPDDHSHLLIDLPNSFKGDVEAGSHMVIFLSLMVLAGLFIMFFKPLNLEISGKKINFSVGRSRRVADVATQKTESRYVPFRYGLHTVFFKPVAARLCDGLKSHRLVHLKALAVMHNWLVENDGNILMLSATNESGMFPFECEEFYSNRSQNFDPETLRMALVSTLRQPTTISTDLVDPLTNDIIKVISTGLLLSRCTSIPEFVSILAANGINETSRYVSMLSDFPLNVPSYPSHMPKPACEATVATQSTEDSFSRFTFVAQHIVHTSVFNLCANVFSSKVDKKLISFGVNENLLAAVGGTRDIVQTALAAVKLFPVLYEYTVYGDPNVLEKLSDPYFRVSLKTRSCIDKYNYDGPTVRGLDELSAAREDLLKYITTHKIKNQTFNDWISEIDLLIRHGTTFLALNRKQPIGIVFYGGSGLGKSSLATTFAQAVCRRVFDSKSKDPSVGYLTTAEFSNLVSAGNEVLIGNDIDATVDANRRTLIAENVLRVAGLEPANINKAEIEQKHQLFNCNVVLLTTNSPTGVLFDSTALTNPTALYRRYPIGVKFFKADTTTQEFSVRYQLTYCVGPPAADSRASPYATDDVRVPIAIRKYLKVYDDLDELEDAICDIAFIIRARDEAVSDYYKRCDCCMKFSCVKNATQKKKLPADLDALEYPLATVSTSVSSNSMLRGFSTMFSYYMFKEVFLVSYLSFVLATAFWWPLLGCLLSVSVPMVGVCLIDNYVSDISITLLPKVMSVPILNFKGYNLRPWQCMPKLAVQTRYGKLPKVLAVICSVAVIAFISHYFCTSLFSEKESHPSPVQIATVSGNTTSSYNVVTTVFGDNHDRVRDSLVRVKAVYPATTNTNNGFQLGFEDVVSVGHTIPYGDNVQCELFIRTRKIPKTSYNARWDSDCDILIARSPMTGRAFIGFDEFAPYVGGQSYYQFIHNDGYYTITLPEMALCPVRCKFPGPPMVSVDTLAYEYTGPNQTPSIHPSYGGACGGVWYSLHDGKLQVHGTLVAAIVSDKQTLFFKQFKPQDIINLKNYSVTTFPSITHTALVATALRATGPAYDIYENWSVFAPSISKCVLGAHSRPSCSYFHHPNVVLSERAARLCNTSLSDWFVTTGASVYDEALCRKVNQFENWVNTRAFRDYVNNHDNPITLRMRHHVLNRVVEIFSVEMPYSTPWTITEAIDGKGLVKPMDMSTSFGPEYGAKRTVIRSHGDIRVIPFSIEANVADMINRLSSDTFCPLGRIATVKKDEVLKIKKLAKQRVIFGASDPITAIVERMFFGPIIDAMYRTREKSNIAIGVNAHSSAEWDRLVRTVFETDSDTNCYFADLSEFDAQMSTDLTNLAIECILLIAQTFVKYDEYSMRVLRNLISGYFRCAIVVNGIIRIITKSNIPGGTMTSWFNSLILIVFFLLCESLGIKLKWIVYGDDNGFKLLSGSVHDLVEFGKLFSLYFVDCNDKTKPPSASPLSGFSFLKRGVRYANGLCYAPLDRSSILKSLMFVRMPISTEVVRSTLNSAWIECYMHGDSADDIRELIFDIAKEYHVMFDFTDPSQKHAAGLLSFSYVV